MTCWICFLWYLHLPPHLGSVPTNFSARGARPVTAVGAGRGCCRYQLPLGGGLVMKAGHMHLSPLAELSLYGGNKTSTYDTSETTPLLILTIAGRNSFHALVHTVLC